MFNLITFPIRLGFALVTAIPLTLWFLATALIHVFKK